MVQKIGHKEYDGVHTTLQLRDALKEEAREENISMAKYASRVIVETVEEMEDTIFLKIYLDKISKLRDKMELEMNELETLQQRKEKTPAEEKRRERLVTSIKRYQHQIGKHLQELPA